MGLLSKDIRSLDDLLIQGLGELLYTERRIAKTLAALAGKVSDPALRRDLEDGLAASTSNIAQIEEVCRRRDCRPHVAESPAIDGIFISAEELAGEIDDDHVLDIAIAGAVQAAAAYTAARYAGLIASLAGVGRTDCCRLLQAGLAHHQRVADMLRLLAEKRLNPRALGRGGRGPLPVAIAS
ncbi:ferritin-like domain-containing protein [Ancylobacter sp.]|uniref:YciE/YciF ferroxidase family protein n=1 Tax=Ancylobacter sp. TaxID=1872567 RepID=UPI003BAD658C